MLSWKAGRGSERTQLLQDKQDRLEHCHRKNKTALDQEQGRKDWGEVYKGDSERSSYRMHARISLGRIHPCCDLNLETHSWSSVSTVCSVLSLSSEMVPKAGGNAEARSTYTAGFCNLDTGPPENWAESTQYLSDGSRCLITGELGRK